LFGKTVKLASGQTVVSDEAYIRESILNPQGQIVEGYQPIMPTFKGQVSEEQLVGLIAYIKSIGGQSGAGTVTANPGAAIQQPNASKNFDTDKAPVEPMGSGSTTQPQGGR
jgi:cytochrome c oxidase subunit 2